MGGGGFKDRRILGDRFSSSKAEQARSMYGMP